MKKNLFYAKGVLLGTLIVVFLCGCGKTTADFVKEDSTTTESQQESSSQVETTQTELPPKEVCVYICGQVKNPGVYTLPEGSRICDVFALAGGLTEEASTEYWNQAQVLTDGEMLYVPSKEEAREHNLESGQTSHTETDDGKVNINTASKEELMSLPGIGEAKALAILAYRQEYGPFTTIEDIQNVEGIKEGVFSKMKEYIKI